MPNHIFSIVHCGDAGRTRNITQLVRSAYQFDIRSVINMQLSSRQVLQKHKIKFRSHEMGWFYAPHAACPSHLIFLDFIALIMSGDGYKIVRIVAVEPCSILAVYQRFGRTNRFHFQGLKQGELGSGWFI